MRFKLLASLLASVLFLPAPAAAVEPLQTSGHLPALTAPEWIRHEVVYEVNVRQYSESGTFAAVEADLPRLHDLGVRVLWFMPIHPIGTVNRKGPLGSYYAVRDYVGVNPEFGTPADFVRLVASAHRLGFRVIMDWVANHTAWDHPWTTAHPGFYARNATGSFVPPYGFDWTDVIQLDFTNRALWDAQIDAMLFWVRTAGVDGFRCDYATGVPTAFWDEASRRLRAERPDLFLLSEAEVPQHQRHAFHASYSFGMMHVFNDVAAGKSPLSRIDDELARNAVLFPAGAARLRYTTNHDENSWQGTVFERLGGGVEPFAVLTFLLDGIPLVYNGQEAGLDRRLKFFERDPITWRPHALAAFYRTLCTLKRSHPALRTGSAMRRLPTTSDAVYALFREADGRRVVAFCNLTARDTGADAVDPALAGRWRDVFTGEIVEWRAPVTLTLPAWHYRVLVSAD